MTWQELPVWVKIRMLINQKIQSGIVDSSVFKKHLAATKDRGGFSWAESLEGGDYWDNTLLGNKLPKESEKLCIIKPSINTYGLQMSHSDAWIHFSPEALSSLGITNPIVDGRFHTFEEHLNNSPIEQECKEFMSWAKETKNHLSSFPVKTLWSVFMTIAACSENEWIKRCIANKYTEESILTAFVLANERNLNVVEIIWKHYKNSQRCFVPKTDKQETNPECLAFKEWAINNGYWERFIADYNDLFMQDFELNHWIKQCNKYKLTGFKIISQNVLTITESKWSKIWKEYQQSHSKSPAEIFIEWAKKNKHIGTTWNLIFSNLRSRADINTEHEAIKFLSGCTNLSKIVNHIYTKVKIEKEWYDMIDREWQNYLKTINYANQLQREENPVTGSTGTAKSKIHLEVNIFDCSRSCYRDGEGYRISRNKISVSENKLSFES